MTVDDTTCSLAGPTTCVIIILGAVADGTGLDLVKPKTAYDITQSLTSRTEICLTVALRTDYHT
jgi:hypothetical protein